VARLSSHFENQAVREAERRSSPVLLQGRGHGVSILDRQVAMVEQQLDRGRQGRGVEAVHRRQDQDRLDEDNVRDPRPARDESLRGRNLPGLVASDQTNEDLRVNS